MTEPTLNVDNKELYKKELSEEERKYPGLDPKVRRELFEGLVPSEEDIERERTKNLEHWRELCQRELREVIENREEIERIIEENKRDIEWLKAHLQSE